MNWLEKLNAKYGRYGIRYITRYMIIAHLLGYVFYYLGKFTGMNLSQWLFFSPTLIFKGQVWRLFTWIFVQNGSFSIWDLIFILFLLHLGDSLEQALGSFRMEIYFISGILLSDIGGILVYLILNVDLGALGYSYGYYGLTLYYILFSLYMMLGLFMPNAQVYLYGVLPIKMKWMLIVWAVMYGYQIVSAFSSGIQAGFFYCSDMIFAFLNVLFFVYSCKHRLSFKQSAQQAARRQQYRQAVNEGYRENRGNGEAAGPRIIHPGAGNSMHKCCICGRTEATNPELTFRYCSKCTGGKEYCNDHLFTHEHS